MEAPRQTAGPHGLRVLVVDDDLVCLKVVSGMLRHCSYDGASAPTP
jgi:CheY-like chemotaxis protein